MACPLKIIETGEADKDGFVLKDDNLASIIDKIPPNTKVAVVSVVGAFRTGKSFLLNFFLRYLRAPVESDSSSTTWMFAEGDELAEGNMNDWNIVNIDSAEEKKKMSFAWRGGQDRQTTGIWMWSEPFIRKSSSGNDIAILLMDTQGMFDNETTMSLTAQIFGLSTLVSSYQIYNVDKRIQEDNLQHLALFSEYGRMALIPQESEESAEKVAKISSNDDNKSIPSEGEKANENYVNDDKPNSAIIQTIPKPFQRLQFLIRDWQNFDTEYHEGDSDEVYHKVREEMAQYLKNVIRERESNDLQSTREQINRCFQTLDCFMLPHPGFDVIKKNFDGSISKISLPFRTMINKYVRHIFDGELEAKIINKRQITGVELKTYFEVYVKMFQIGEKSFPKAMTMLDATAEANNRNAYDLSLANYKSSMDTFAGPNKSYTKDNLLQTHHDEIFKTAMAIFTEIATMGADSTIQRMRDAEMYVLPLLVAAVSWLIANIVDRTCGSDFCEATEDTFVNIYLFIVVIVIALTWRHLRGIFHYLKELSSLMLQDTNNNLNK
eukprot:gene7123-9720_t